MLVSLYALGKVVGAEVMLIGVLVCAALYLAAGLIPRCGRARKGRRAVWLGLLGAELVCDGAWWLLYFPDGDYHNHGIGGVYGALLWPLLLLVVGGVVWAVNAGREQPNSEV